MTDMLSTILVSLPIFLIIFAGWLFQKAKVMEGDWVHQANAFAYYAALPALIVVSLWDINFRSPEIIRLTLASLASMTAFLAVLFVVLSLFTAMKRDTKAAIFLTAATGNTLYMGIALVEVGFGKDQVPAAALVGNIYLIIPLVLSILVVRYWHTKDHSIKDELMAFLKNPLVLSVALGIALSFVPVEHAAVASLKKTMQMLGSTSSPVALFALGGFLYGKFLKKDLHMVMFITALKMIVFPLVVFGIYAYFAKGVSADMPVLLATMPVAVTTFVIAEKFKLNTALVGNAIVFATLMSFITAPIILLLFK